MKLDAVNDGLKVSLIRKETDFFNDGENHKHQHSVGQIVKAAKNVTAYFKVENFFEA